MARSIGSVEITVDADTKRLRAQIVKDAEVAGRQAKKALDAELSKIEAELSLNSKAARAELRKFKEASERAGVELRIGLDATRAEEEWFRLQEELERTEIRLKAGLDKGSEARVRTQIEKLEDEIHQIEFGLSLNGKDREILEAQLKRIEVEDHTVEMRAQLEEAELLAEIRALEADKVKVGFTADFSQAMAEYERMRAELSASRAEVPIDGDLTDFNLKVREIRAKLALERFQIKLELDDKEMRAALFAAEAEAERHHIEIQVQAEEFQAGLRASLFEAEAEAERHHIELKVELQTALALAEGEAIRARISELEAQIAIHPDQKSAEFIAAKAELNELMGEIGVEVVPDISEPKWAAARARMAAITADAGKDSGESFSGGFGSGLRLLPGQFTEWLPLIAAAIEPIGPLIEGVFGGATQVISSAFSALAGGAGALTPIIAGIGATLGATVIGSLGLVKSFSAITKEWGAATDAGREFDFQAKEIQKTLRNMGPAARNVAMQFAELFPVLRKIQNTVAEHLFAGMGEELERMSKTLLPNLGTALVDASDSANRFFTGMARAAESTDFSGIFRAISPALDLVGKAMASAFGALEPLLKATAPAALSLARALDKGAESLTKLAKSGAASGALTKFFTDGVASLIEWAKLIGSVSKALFTLFQAGKKGGDGMISSLTKVTDQFNEWMKSTKGQEALAKFFDRSREILADLAPLLKGLAIGLKNIVTASGLESFRRLTEDLGAALPVIGDIIGLLSRANITGALVTALRTFTEALKPVLPDLQKMADTIGVALQQAVVAITPLLQDLAGFIGGVARAVTPVVETLGNMIAVLRPLTPLIEGIALGFLAWKVINGITKGVADGLTSLGAKLIKTQENFTLFGAAVQQAGTNLKGLGTGITTAFKGGGFDQIGNSLKNLGPALSVIGKASGAVIGTAIAGGISAGFGFEMLRTSKDTTDKVKGVATIAAAAVGSFFAVGGGPQGLVAAGLTTALGFVADKFKENEQKAKEAKAAVDKFAAAILEMERTGSKAAPVTAILTDWTKLTDKQREAMLKSKFVIGDWAAAAVEGTKSANDAMADWLATILGANDPLVEMVRTGKMSLEQIGKSFNVEGVHAGQLSGNLATLGDYFESMGLSAKDVSDIFFKLSGDQGNLTKGTEANAEASRDAALAAQELGGGVSGVWPVMNDLAAIVPDTTGSLYDFSAGASEAAAKAAFLAEGAKKIDAKKLADGLAALDTAMGRTGDTFDTVKDQVFGVRDALTDTEKHWTLIAEAADKAAEKASDFADVMDKMLDPAMNMAEATSDFEADLDDLSDKLKENADKTKEWQKKRDEAAKKGEKFTDVLELNAISLDLNTEAGRDNAAAVRKGIEDIAGMGEAMLASGKSTGETTAKMLEMRQELIKQVAPFAGGEAAAEAYINSLNLTPENITTSVELIGIQEAATKILDYDFDLDGVRDSVDTTFNLPNLDEVRKRLQEAGVDVSKLSDPVLIEFLMKGFTEAQTQLATTDTAVETAGGTVPIDVSVSDDWAAADASLATLGGFTDGPNAVAITATAPGLDVIAADAEGLMAISQTGIKIGVSFDFIQGSAITDDIGGLLSMGGQGPQTIPNVPVQAKMTGFEDADAAMALLGGQIDPIKVEASLDPVPVNNAIGEVKTNLQDISKDWPVTISLPNIDTNTTKVNNLDTAIDGLKDKTVTVTVKTNLPPEIAAALFPPGSRPLGSGSTVTGGMAGKMITSPQFMYVGERSRREALIPLDLPLSRVDPSVRDLAALVRGEGGKVVLPSGKTVNNYMTITPLSANPEAIATQVINRSVALART